MGEKCLYDSDGHYWIGAFECCEVIVLRGRLSSPVNVAGLIVFDSVVGKRLAFCPLMRKVLCSRVGFPRLYHSLCVCSVDSCHCDTLGVRLKFGSYGIDSLRVLWVCPKVTDLSFLNGDV